jgi:hypothetical protein
MLNSCNRLAEKKNNVKRRDDACIYARGALVDLRMRLAKAQAAIADKQ